MEKKFKCDFNFGAKIEMIGEDLCDYEVLFIDSSDGKIIHKDKIKPGYWTKTSKQYFINYKIVVKLEEEIVYEHKIDLKGKKVLIESLSKALGDNICWTSFYEEFRKKHGCQLYVKSFFSNFLSEKYPEIIWISPSEITEDNFFYASYQVSVGIENEVHNEGIKKLNKYHQKKIPIKYIKGLTFHDQNLHKEHPLSIPMQKIASNCLGMEYEEKRPRYENIPLERPIEKKYICISEFASAGGMKIWNNKIGWQTLVDEIKKYGIEVVSISKEKSDLKNITKRNGNYDLEDRMWYLKHAEFFIGLPSGLSWLNWAVGKKTVMVGGFSEDWCEYQEDNIRVKNYESCTGCFNSSEHSDKLCCFHETFCPENRNFECSRKISPKMVIEKIIENNLV
jgi:hypothetical protein